MTRLNTHLAFDGKCLAAFQFYEKCLGGKIIFKITYGESPMAQQTAPDWRDRIMHLSFSFRDQILAGADAPQGYYRKPQGFCVSLSVDDPAEAERIFKGLSENAQVQMPLQETFWAQRFGMLIDQFAVPWMINCEKPDVSGS